MVSLARAHLWAHLNDGSCLAKLLRKKDSVSGVDGITTQQAPAIALPSADNGAAARTRQFFTTAHHGIRRPCRHTFVTAAPARVFVGLLTVAMGKCKRRVEHFRFRRGDRRVRLVHRGVLLCELFLFSHRHSNNGRNISHARLTRNLKC